MFDFRVRKLRKELGYGGLLGKDTADYPGVNMVAVPFDTLKMAERMEAAGFTAKQARALVEALVDVMSEDRAKLDTQAELENLQMKMLVAIAKTKTDLIRWVASVSVMQMALMLMLIVA